MNKPGKGRPAKRGRAAKQTRPAARGTGPDTAEEPGTVGEVAARQRAGQAARRPAPPPRNAFDAYFGITARGSTIGREVRGGLATFFTMAYIIVLNPIILGFGQDADGDVLGSARVAAVTALVAGVMTILMGVIGRFPLAIAAGLGLNAFVAVGIATKMSWADAMGLVVIEGLIVTVLVLTGFRTAVFNAVPAQLKIAISVGIGLFLTLIGLVDSGFVRRIPDVAGTVVPVQLGVDNRLLGWPTLVFVVGVLAMIVLVVRGVKGAILFGIVGATLLAIVVEAIAQVGPQVEGGRLVNPTGWSLNTPRWPDDIVDVPDFSLLGGFSLLGSFERVGAITAVLFVFTLMLADFFDTMGTMVAVATEADLLDEDGNVPNAQQILLVDSMAAAAGGAASVSSNTSYIESAAGVAEGARTGVASIVTGVLFLFATILAPLVSIVPFEAASPALVVVGFIMAIQLKNIDWSDYEIAIPAFLTMVLMPFTYSITVGIGAGFITYVLIKAVRGKARQVHPLLWGVSALFVVYFAIGPIQQLLGVD
jgi:AGZA family xanthine/uracil permease-like MFS transporter